MTGLIALGIICAALLAWLAFELRHAPVTGDDLEQWEREMEDTG